MVGAGKLGTPVALAIEACGHDVYVTDINTTRRDNLANRFHPEREENLQPLLDTHDITWCDSIHELVEKTDLIFVSVQTPHIKKFEGDTPLQDPPEDFDYSYLTAAIEEVAEACAELEQRKVVASISTCLPGTFKREIEPLLNKWVDFAHSPQFIAMSTVVQDYLFPEFVLIGAEDKSASEVLESFFTTITDAPSVVTDVTTAEGIKLSYNSLLGTKIQLANAWGELSERLGMNVDDIYKAWSLSTRRLISPRYLSAGMGDGGCLDESQMVFTEGGLRPINTVRVGERVLAHDGRLHRVNHLFEREFDGELIALCGTGVPGMRLTPNHRVFVARPANRDAKKPILDNLNDIEGVPAEDLQVGDYLAVPSMQGDDLTFADVDYAEFGGMYVADGHITKSNRSYCRVGLTIGSHKSDRVERAEELLQLFSRNKVSKATKHENNTATDLVTHDHLLYKRLEEDFGRYSYGKRIPAEVLYGNENVKWAFLRGAWGGDGCQYRKCAGSDAFDYVTVSTDLAVGMAHLLRSLGISAALQTKAQLGKGTRTCYHVAISSSSSVERFANGLGVTAVTRKSSMNRMPFYNGYTLHRVSGVERQAFSGTVYNLEVDQANTYVTQTCAVHNSCHPRDNIAMSWLSDQVGMSKNLWNDLMEAREETEHWHAECAAAAAEETGLPLILLGRAFKPETDIETGSAAILMANILKGWDEDFIHVNDLDEFPQAVYFISTNNERYREYPFPSGSLVIDPFGDMPSREGVEIHRLGRKCSA